MRAQPASTELGNRIYNASDLAIVGEPLNAERLRRFYARHGFEPVWETRQAQADSLIGAVMRAGDHGLDPNLFHADLLQRRAALPSLDCELLLSDAFLSYAGALAYGAVPVKLRGPNETLTPEPVDVTAVLELAIGSPDPGAAIEALAPTTPAYLALRRAMKIYRPRALAGDSAATRRLRKIEVNLERQRWLLRPLPTERVWVNVADERLLFYRADQPVFSTRVVVGQDVERNQSPEFRAMIEASFFNPPWVIPRDIVSREILPQISRDPDYLKKNDMIMLANGEAEQLPGPEAGLGLIMFDMPNRFDVYLHDTPDRDIFNLANRRDSHGCIRVQNPRELASLLLQQPISTINQEIAKGSTTERNLPVPVPVFVVYQTAFLDTEGTLQYRSDFYGRDAQIWQQLQSNSNG
ncbi:MAG TPA: L,D-transpeptidase family protein [Acidocella sp.]|nr:L,D-transpeptidase family protein [Acidocella sp.]